MMNNNKEDRNTVSENWAHTVLWLGFWFILIGGCTAVEIWGK